MKISLNQSFSLGQDICSLDEKNYSEKEEKKIKDVKRRNNNKQANSEKNRIINRKPNK